MALLSPEIVPWLKVLLLPLAVLHLAIAARMLGGSLVAAARDFYRRPQGENGGNRLTRELLRRSAKGFFLAPLLLAGLAGWLICLHFAYAALPFPAWLWWALFLPLTAGLVLLYYYRFRHLLPEQDSPPSPLTGLFGVLLCFAAYFVFFSFTTLATEPEQWPFLASNPFLLLSWSGVARFGEFLLIALALAGIQAAALTGRESPRHDRPARIASVVTGGALMLWPLLVLFDLYNLPRYTLSPAVFLLAATTVLAAGGGFLCLVTGNLRERAITGPAHIVIGILLVVWILSAHIARENAMAGEVVHGLEEMTGMRAKVSLPEPPAAEPPDAMGRKVFEQYCSVCHRFDRKLVGPPLQEVLPAYRGREAALKTFIKDPVKKNPEYPPMPKLGLSDAEIDAVAAFVLEEIKRSEAVDGGKR